MLLFRKENYLVPLTIILLKYLFMYFLIEREGERENRQGDGLKGRERENSKRAPYSGSISKPRPHDLSRDQIRHLTN